MRKMADPIRKTDHHYTYADARQWPEDDRWELIDGVAYSMSSPTDAHQHISMELGYQIRRFLEGKPCRVIAAPFDVLFYRLPEQDENDVDTVVQPDLLVTCDRGRIRPNGHWGAPDLVVEILSPSTSRKDQNEKYNLYERSGVKEYWVIDPAGRWVQQYLLEPNGRYAPEVTRLGKGSLVSPTIAGLEIAVETLWPETSFER